MRNFSGRFLIVSFICVSLWGCTMSVKDAQQRFERISSTRPIGSKCTHEDSASVKRAMSHPSFPTGGWHHDPANTFVDYSRTLERDTNAMTRIDNCIAGYVRFDRPGYLQSRLYDDYFGSVYGGWCPSKLHIKSTKEHVYVSLPLCHVGDGGLDEVYEVAWFPEGEDNGILIFSSAHPSPEPKLDTADLYRPDQLGNPYRFNDAVATDVINKLLQRGDITGTKKVISLSLEKLASMQDYMDGATRVMVPAKIFMRSSWNTLLLYKLGLDVGTEDFPSTFKQFQENLNGENRGDKTFVSFDEPMIPLYGWLNDRLGGKTSAVPDVKPTHSHMSGHDAPMIAQFLKGEISEKEFFDSSANFWIGINKYLSKDYDGAALKFQIVLTKWNSPFNRACAAKLLDKMKHSAAPRKIN